MRVQVHQMKNELCVYSFCLLYASFCHRFASCVSPLTSHNNCEHHLHFYSVMKFIMSLYTCICEEERTKFIFVFSHQKLFVLHIFLLLSRLLAVCTTFDSNENFVFMAGYRFFLFDRNGNEGQHIHEIRSTHSSKCNNSFHWLLTNEISSFCIIFNKREGMEERRGGNKITHIKICFLVFGIT